MHYNIRQLLLVYILYTNNITDMNKKTILATLVNAGIWGILNSIISWFIASFIGLNILSKMWIEPLVIPTIIAFWATIIFLIFAHIVSKILSKNIENDHSIIACVSTLIFALFLISIWVNFLDLGITVGLFFWISYSNIMTSSKKKDITTVEKK